jgi:cation:H+ antiporter
MISEILLWTAVMATGFLVTVYASRYSVSHVTELASGTKIPPFIIGITLVALGTDLPEIANSIVASFMGRGDINVGDSIGSATVQSTLILGLLPLVAGSFPIARGRVAKLGAATVGALLLGAALMADGELSRFDAAILIGSWILGTVVVARDMPREAQPETKAKREKALKHLWPTIGGLLLVGLGAITAIQALTRLAEVLEFPEYLVAFLLASVGTSLPELTVSVTAVKRGQWDLAMGNILGASFIDSTLSLGAGPLLFPIAVTADLAVTGSIIAAAAIGFVMLILSIKRRHDWLSGVTLVGVFLLVYALLLNST